MTSKKSKIIKELDPQDVEGLSQARIEHYLSLGYRPYLDDKSQVKWLTQAQMSMRNAKSLRVPFTRRILPKKQANRYRKKRYSHGRFRFFRVNWFFILILLIIVIFVILVLLNPDLIF